MLTWKQGKDEVLLTGIGEKAFKNFQLKVILEQAKGLRQGGEGFTGILEITLLMSIIQDQTTLQAATNLGAMATKSSSLATSL